jgi:hypothetical protein
MHEFVTQINSNESVSDLNDLNIQDYQRVVGVYSWLIEEDKRQNSEHKDKGVITYD